MTEPEPIEPMTREAILAQARALAATLDPDHARHLSPHAAVTLAAGRRPGNGAADGRTRPTASTTPAVVVAASMPPRCTRYSTRRTPAISSRRWP